MSDPNLFRLRITFCKQGRLSLLSHLEIARALERAIRRAGLPYAVSQGFSPHMRIAFGAALPVGVGGTDEMVDLLLTRYVKPDEALLALQKASTPDLMVKACDYVSAQTPAVSAQFPLGTYEVILSESPIYLAVPSNITVVRKKKEKVLNVADFLVGELVLSGRLASFTLESKLTGSLRPDVLIKQCLALTQELSDFDVADAEQKAAELQAGIVFNTATDLENGGLGKHALQDCVPRICSMMRVKQAMLGG